VGILTSLGNLCFGKRAEANAAATFVSHSVNAGSYRGRRCHLESLEERRYMAADVAPQVLLGSVYFEEATGDDSQPDIIQISFEGGAAGTTLNEIVIDGDKLGDGLSSGDIFFDTEEGGLGAFGDVGFSIVSTEGFSVTSVLVVDGGSQIKFTFSGFDAGEVFKFSLDADEAQFVGGGVTDTNALVEGAEFQRSRITGTFKAPHFVDLTLQGTYWDAFNNNFAAAQTATGLTLDLPNDRYVVNHDYTDRTAGAVVHAAQIPLATISGHVYHDRDDDGNFDTPSEQGIGGVTLELLKDGVATGITTTTASNGYYEFIDLVPGSYGVREVQPAGWFDGKDTAGSHGGSVTNDRIVGAVLNYGDDGINYNFGELLPGSISGRVILSQGPDCDFDDPQQFLENIQIDLLDSNGNVLQTTYTNAQGEYEFTGLAPGSYQVREHQPTQYYDGGEKVGSAGGSKYDVAGQYSIFTGIVITSDLDAIRYDFCEHIGADLSGWVYHDRSNEGTFNRPTEEGIGGVTLELLLNGVATGVTTVTSTASGTVGYYQFTNLAPGTYSVREVQPAIWLDGKDKEGSHGGVATNDLISQIVLDFGDDAVEYNFGELKPGSIRGTVHADPGEDCNFDDPQNMLEGVRIDLLDASGNVLATTFTDENGAYEFTGLAPGEYQVREHQPTEYFDGGERIGTAGGSKYDVTDTYSIFTGINLTSGFNAINYDFCEKPPASIRGRVVANNRPECDYINPDYLLKDVRIDLLDASGNVVATTLTNAAGEYEFTGLRKGIYQVREHQPDDYYDGGERIGTAGGVSFDIGDEFSMITEIVLVPGMNAIQYDFCEKIGVMLSGNVYHDRDDDGNFDRPTEEGIAGVVVKLLDESGNDTGLRATTNAQGFYKFNNLKAGKYTVVEVHPSGWIDGKDTPGNLGGNSLPVPGDVISNVTIAWGQAGTEYNFGELKPGSIRGQVVVSTDPECDPDDGEPPIAGVRIDLLDASGNVVATTLTDANGEYAFTGLRPGIYSVAEHQPAGYFNLCAHVGDGGGIEVNDDLLAEIPVGSGDHLTNYDFCEGPPAIISGYVYIDGAPIITDVELTPQQIYAQRNGVRSGDDTPLAGIVLELRDGTDGQLITGDMLLPGTHAGGPVRVTTDANGYYQFIGLPAGTYAVVQVQPTGYIDNRDIPGLTGGFAVNPDGVPATRLGDPSVLLPIDVPGIIDQFRAQFGDNAIVRIPLSIGQHSQENNFSEVLTQPEPPEVPPYEYPPPPEPEPFFAMPNFPYRPRLFVPPPLPVKKPEWFGGSAKALGYTWHLSVVNAGAPRSISEATAIYRLTAATTTAAAWTEVPLDAGEWTLGRFEGGNVSILREQVFGHPEGKPVTGDFDGDGITDVGIFHDGRWYLDVNGNGTWDDGDLWAKLGTEVDLPVTGDWDDDGKTDIGIFGPAWARDPWAIQNEPGLPDAENNPTEPIAKRKNMPPIPDEATSGGRLLQKSRQGKPRADLIDHVFLYGAPGDVPITGDWNGDGIRAIGVYRDGQWTLDLDGDGRFTETDGNYTFGQTGDLPVIGDFNGDGVDEIGVYRDGQWIIDTNGNRQIDAHDAVFALGGEEPGEVPVVGDWDGDGTDDPGTYRPGVVQDRVSRRAG
jgi:serine-aspartate repeat-containing protein C/D/E